MNQDFRKTPPAVSETESLTLPGIETILLPSGLTLKIYRRPDMQLIYLSVLCAGGQAEAGSPAVAALTSILQREGSRGYSGKEIADRLDYNGAWTKSNATSHHLQQSIYVLGKRFADVIPVFADMVARPVFPETEFEVRRDHLASNLRIALENVSYLSRCRADALIMGESHPLAATDTPESIMRLTPARLAAFHASVMSAASTTVFICGNVTAQMIDTVAEAFSRVIPAAPPTPLNITPFRRSPLRRPVIVPKPDATQSSVAITLPGVPRTHPDYLPLHLSVFALGGYFGSRLMLNIREEKGLTYGINASLQGYADGSFIDITAETDNAYVGRVIEEVGAELLRLADNPPEADELRRMRRSATLLQSSLLDSPLSIVDHHINHCISALPEGYFNAKQQAINQLTPDTIARIARRYLNPALMQVTVAGNPAEPL